MREASVTCTVGDGCERHNHDLDYRATLEHVHKMQDGVIELIPYVDYQTKINAIMKPFIDEYNENVEKRYQAAWERYNAGEIKSKPKRKDFPKMSYDYYSEHLNDTYYDQHDHQTKPMPLFRELLVGIGDQADRENGIITEDEAKQIFARFVERFQKQFPNFVLLGATMHLDEQGFYHCHVDYKPLTYKPMTKGLNVSVSHEEAMKDMGLDPEQSLINGRDKAPLRFNAFRNACYQIMDDEMRECGIYLQYGVSKTKEPDKDSGTHQNLDNWKDKRDADRARAEKDKIWDQSVEKAREIKHQSNIVRDILDNGDPSAENLAKAIEAGMKMQQTLEEVENSPKTTLRNGFKISFKLFDQLKTVAADFAETFGKLCLKLKEFAEKLDKAERERDQAKADYNDLATDYRALEVDYANLQNAYEDMEQENADLREQLAKKGKLDDRIRLIDDAKDRQSRDFGPK